MTRDKRSTRPPRRVDSRRPARSAVVAAQRLRAERLPQNWFAQRLLLVLSGLRPVHTMLGNTSPQAYEQLVRLAPLAPLRGEGSPGATSGPAPSPVLERVSSSTPRPGAIEACARISAGERSRALAFRLEQGTDRRWRCSAVELDIELGAAAR